jgi:hypothetical protein
VRYSTTHFSGSVPVGDMQNNWTYAEVVPTELRVNPTYSKVSALKYTHVGLKRGKIEVRKG